MPSFLNNIIKCLMICKTKCRINSKCSKCCEVNIDFEEGPKNCDTPLQENKISDNIFIISDKTKNYYHKFIMLYLSIICIYMELYLFLVKLK